MRHVLSILAGFAFLAGCTSLNGATAGDESMDGSMSMSATDSMSGMEGMSGMSGMPMGMVHVKVLDGAFNPQEVNATTDGGIHFTNEGSQRHTVTIVDSTGAIVLDVTLDAGQSVHFQPEAAGPYHAFDRMHDGMSAELHVH